MNSKSPRSKTISLSSLCFRVTYLGERDMHERLPTVRYISYLLHTGSDNHALAGAECQARTARHTEIESIETKRLMP